MKNLLSLYYTSLIPTLRTYAVITLAALTETSTRTTLHPILFISFVCLELFFSEYFLEFGVVGSLVGLHLLAHFLHIFT